MNPIQTLIMDWQSRRWRHQFAQSQARNCSDADVRWFASGNGVLTDLARREMALEARRRGLQPLPFRPHA